jgi:transcriptional regulator with XRE-family HTH domain
MSQHANVNTQWFQNKIETKGLSQRVVAKALKVDPSAITQIFYGRRKLSIAEAAELARVLQEPLEDVLHNAGIKTASIAMARNTLIVAGAVDSASRVTFGASAVKGQRSVPYPSFLGRGAAALRFQTGAGGVMDGALVYFHETNGKVDPEAWGRLSVVELQGKRGKGSNGGKGEWYVGVLSRGYQAGTVNLTTIAGAPVVEGGTLVSAAAVVWIKL